MTPATIPRSMPSSSPGDALIYTRGNLRLHHLVFFIVDSKSKFHADFKSVGGKKISSGEKFLQALFYPYPSTLAARPAISGIHCGSIAGLPQHRQSNRANAFAEPALYRAQGKESCIWL